MQFEARPPAGGEDCDQAVLFIQRGSKRASPEKNAPMRKSYEKKEPVLTLQDLFGTMVQQSTNSAAKRS